MAAEVKRALAGVWLLEQSENVENYLKELGVGACERKKCTADDNLKQTIAVNDDVIHIEMDFGNRHCKHDFKLGEEYEIRAGKISKAIGRWENETLIVEMRRVECGRLQVIERKLEGDRLVQTMTSNGVTCRRIFRRA